MGINDRQRQRENWYIVPKFMLKLAKDIKIHLEIKYIFPCFLLLLQFCAEVYKPVILYGLTAIST